MCSKNAVSFHMCGGKIRAQPLCRQFTYLEILSATNNFHTDLEIGKGVFGKVYKGEVFNGSCNVVVAIKRLDLDPKSEQGEEEFRAEIELLPRLYHCNLIALIGYCMYKKERILVYEYSSRGSLEYHLHKLGTPLSFRQRVNIGLGVARGLQYLHTGTGIGSGILHRDIKSANILLDNSWDAKIADFGLSKTCLMDQPLTVVETSKRVEGSFGYIDPNCFRTGRLTRRSDVYAFGVVLLEMLCRKQAVFTTPDEHLALVTWAQRFFQKRNFEHMIDSELMGRISSTCLEEFVGIVQGCLHDDPMQRPTMGLVVGRIESLLLTILADDTKIPVDETKILQLGKIISPMAAQGQPLMIPARGIIRKCVSTIKGK